MRDREAERQTERKRQIDRGRQREIERQRETETDTGGWLCRINSMLFHNINFHNKDVRNIPIVAQCLIKTKSDTRLAEIVAKQVVTGEGPWIISYSATNRRGWVIIKIENHLGGE